MKSFKTIVLFSLLMLTSLEANAYQYMSTSELEQEVQKQSINGTLPFKMGLELIKRWSENS